MSFFQNISSWTGHLISWPRQGEALTKGTSLDPIRLRRDEEKLASGPMGIRLPYFLPYFDQQQSVFETQEMRFAYRKMLADPNVKSAVLAKIFGVASLELRINPSDNDDDRCKIMADFVHWNFARRLRGGVINMVWSILSGGLIDGFSVCEKVWALHEKGRWMGKTVLRDLKPKDVDQDLVVEADQYRNITGIRGLRYNPGMVYSPDDFLIYHHCPMYGNPTGMSDLRAAYGRWWFLDTIIKIRAMGAEKRALPLIWGSYTDSTKLPALMKALAAAKSQNWLAVPESVKLQALEIAGAANDYFRSFCADLREEIVLGIAGATLQSTAGSPGKVRGDSSTHKDSADLRAWFLAATILQLLNDHENGLIKELCDLNFADIDEYPVAAFGGIDDAELAETLKIDQILQSMGFKHKVEDIAERYGRQSATDEDEPLVSLQEKQQTAAAPPTGEVQDDWGAVVGDGTDRPAKPNTNGTPDKFSEKDVLGTIINERKLGQYVIKEVDAAKLRCLGKDAEEFGNFATHLEHSFIPKGQIWVDSLASPGDKRFWMDNAMAQLRAAAKGASADKAYDIGLSVERAEREKAAGLPKRSEAQMRRQTYIPPGIKLARLDNAGKLESVPG